MTKRKAVTRQRKPDAIVALLVAILARVDDAIAHLDLVIRELQAGRAERAPLPPNVEREP